MTLATQSEKVLRNTQPPASPRMISVSPILLPGSRRERRLCTWQRNRTGSAELLACTPAPGLEQALPSASRTLELLYTRLQEGADPQWGAGWGAGEETGSQQEI